MSDVHPGLQATTQDSDDTGRVWTPSSLCYRRRAQRQQVKRVNVQVPDDIHTRAKVIAVVSGITLNEYLERAIRTAVEKDASILDTVRSGAPNKRP